MPHNGNNELPSDSNLINAVSSAQEHPIARILLAVFNAHHAGAGTPVDAILRNYLNRKKASNLRKFFEELARGEWSVTPEILDVNDTVHAIVTTVEAVESSRDDRKIHRFANLLKGALRENVAGRDLYDEYLSILRDLSDRELQLLTMLWQFQCTKEFGVGMNRLQESQVRDYWTHFQAKVRDELDIDSQLLNSLMERIRRTGFYAILPATDSDSNGAKGYLTEYYERFALWVLDQDENPRRPGHFNIGGSLRFNEVG